MSSQLVWEGRLTELCWAMANSDGADAEENALQCLLDAFPTAPLELIASAFTQANSDADLAAELISFSLNGISCKQPPDLPPPHRSSHATAGKGASTAKRLHTSSTLSHGRPLLRPKGPCPPTLEEFFPSSPEKNAWIERLTDRLQKNVSLQDPLEHDIQHGYSPDEFPSLEARISKEKSERVWASGLPPPMRSNVRSSSRASAAFGLASSARSRSCKESSTKTLSAGEKGSTNHFKQQETKEAEKSLWPTETEAALLSMLGDEFDLDIEAVRDVLGHYEGDIEKSFEVLSQLSLPPSSSDHPLRSILEFQMVEKKNISLTQGGGVHEAFPISEERRDSPQLAKVLLESLFSKPQEVNAEIEEKHKHTSSKKKEKEAVKPPEIPEWKAITSTQLDISGDAEGRGKAKALNVMCEEMVVKCSETAVSENEDGNMQMSSYGDWDSYERHHASAKEHWKTMQSYLKAATAAYAESNFSKAELLTEKANTYKQLSMEAKERANKFLLEMESRQNESDFTLDLQEQHVTEALQLLRLHLKSFSSIPSCHMFTVITGCQEDTKSGRIKLKHEVVGYLRKKGYTWVETSPFCLQIQLKKHRAALVDEREGARY